MPPAMRVDFLLKDIPMNGKQDYDVLGFIYEYLISMFAANAGKKAGEFYTPHEVSILMSEIVADHLKSKKEIQIYDPTSGSGSLLINIGRSVAKHMDDENNIKYYAQELKQNTYNLTRMNLVMRGIIVDNIVTRNGDTLEDDWPYFDENDPVNSYSPLYVDAVVSNPPYSQKWDPTNKDVDPRYARFGLAPKTKADYAFLLHDLFHIKPHGIMAIVLPHGVLFRGGEEGTIRKNLIESNNIDTIIGLPANIFFGTGIPTIIMVLKQKRANTDVLIVDASKGFIKVGKNNQLRASDIKRIADTVIARHSVDKFSNVVSRDEIRENEYNLNIPRYIDSTDAAESWDIYASMFGGIPKKEIDTLEEYWDVFPELRAALFTKVTKPYSGLKVKNVMAAIVEHPEIKVFIESFRSSFKTFDRYLKKELISNMAQVNISRKETELSHEIYKRLKDLPLIDKYEAYQILDDEWNKIAGDLEILQSEGFASAKQVDPNMVIKKKDGKDQEVQEGWKGHIFPFELVQRTYLEEEYNELKEKENRLAEITAQYGEILDSLSEDDKENDTINETKDGFVNAEVKKETRQIEADMKKGATFADDSYESNILKVSDLLDEEKIIKADIKSETARLHLLTKDTIEKLTDEQVIELLECKWIYPLENALHNLPVVVINKLADSVQALAEKYAVTYEEVVNQIHETENTLATLMDELTGSEYDMKGISEFKSLLRGE
jgi:type I restriction enzyme M protein